MFEGRAFFWGGGGRIVWSSGSIFKGHYAALRVNLVPVVQIQDGGHLHSAKVKKALGNRPTKAIFDNLHFAKINKAHENGANKQYLFTYTLLK